jgi:hypothetical protein
MEDKHIQFLIQILICNYIQICNRLQIFICNYIQIFKLHSNCHEFKF